MTRSSRLHYVPLLASDLRALGACKDEVEKFARLFPNGATPDDIDTAVTHDLAVEWLCDVLAPSVLWAEYDRQVAALWAEYDRQRALLRAEYQRQEAPLRAEYDRQVAPLWAEYQRQRALLWADLLAACWPVWDTAL